MRLLIKRIHSEKDNISSILGTSAINIFASFFLMIAFANLINSNQLGIYQYILSSASIIGSLSLSGAGTALIRAAGKKSHHSFAKLFKYSYVGMIPAVLVAICASFYYLYKENYYLATGILVSTIGVLGLQIALRYNAIYVGLEKFKLSNNILKAIALGPLTLLLPLLFVTDNPSILASVYTLSSLLFASAVIFFYRMSQEVQHLIKTSSLQQDKSDKKYLSFAFHQSIINLINSASAHFDKIIIFQMLGAQSTAIYFIAVSIPDRLRSILKQFEPYLFAKSNKYNPESSIKNINKKFFIALAGLIPVYICYLLIAPPFFGFFIKEYYESVALTLIYGLSIFGSAAIIPTSFMKAHGNDSSFYVYTAITTLSKFLFIYFGILYAGLTGAIVGSVISTGFNTASALLIIQFKKFMQDDKL